MADGHGAALENRGGLVGCSSAARSAARNFKVDVDWENNRDLELSLMTNMKSFAKEALRWFVIVTSGGYGLWQLIDAGRRAIGMRWSGDGSDVFGFFVILMPLLVAAPCLAVAYSCLRRQYRRLFIVLGVIGCLAIFVGLSTLPEQLGMFQFLDRQIHENHEYAFLGLPFALLAVFGPIYVAAWFYRLCHRFAYPDRPRTKTRATRWLIWLGLFCMIVPPMMDLLVTFSKVTQSANVAVSLDSICWTIGISVVGLLLMFLGLVRRRPITELKIGNAVVETSTSTT